MNPSAAPDADRALATDADERVLVMLARKLAALTTGLPADAQSRLRQQAYETLTSLITNEAVRVRAAVSEAVKDMPDMPRILILRLAHDPSVMVAEPVILFSPVLSSQDLLTLVAAAPSPGTVRAVASRPSIGPAVSDAIAASANAEAIHALLANPSAQIREAVLDALIAASAEHTDWQEPLVKRPLLPLHSARALSEIVSPHHMETLAARADLDQELAARLAARLAPDPIARIQEATDDEALAEARRLARAGLLTEQVLLGAVRRGERRLAAALLAVSADVPVSIVDHAGSRRSAKGLLSLVWQAGFTMRAGSAVQGLLGWLPPGEALPAGPGGGFPLSVEEMQWQVAFLEQAMP